MGQLHLNLRMDKLLIDKQIHMEQVEAIFIIFFSNLQVFDSLGFT
jgi:hypothetical protein